jgi:hypothetical protein
MPPLQEPNNLASGVSQLNAAPTVAINAGLIFGNKALGLAVRADGGYSSQSFLERCKDRRLCRGIEPLEFPRCRQVVATESKMTVS